MTSAGCSAQPGTHASSAFPGSATAGGSLSLSATSPTSPSVSGGVNAWRTGSIQELPAIVLFLQLNCSSLEDRGSFSQLLVFSHRVFHMQHDSHHHGQLSKDKTPFVLMSPHALSCCYIMKKGWRRVQEMACIRVPALPLTSYVNLVDTQPLWASLQRP